jgi:hypothetical protein
MKNRTLNCFLAIMVAVLSAGGLQAQSNSVSALILPPKDWAHDKHILALLVITNKPGNYPLVPTWDGVQKVTVCTGLFTNAFERRYQTNQLFHFDRLTVCSGSILPKLKEDRFICEADGSGQVPGSMFGYRSTLPSDKELLGMQDVASATNFFGFNAFEHFDGRQSEIGVNYFTLAAYDSIETLNVTFMKGAGTNIAYMIVKRGHFRCK